METLTTNGIKISVESFYQEDYSKPAKGEYIFAYRITIENKSPRTVQLLRRHWYIWDMSNITREVEGEGVIGKQPILAPGEQHQYISGSSLRSTIGKMYGSYQMVRELDGQTFSVRIPVFHLIAPFKMN